MLNQEIINLCKVFGEYIPRTESYTCPTDQIFLLKNNFINFPPKRVRIKNLYQGSQGCKCSAIEYIEEDGYGVISYVWIESCTKHQSISIFLDNNE